MAVEKEEKRLPAQARGTETRRDLPTTVARPSRESRKLVASLGAG